MWLNVFITGFASLSVGFILGWVMGRPWRWDRHVFNDVRSDDTVSDDARSNDAGSVPARHGEDLPPLPTTLTMRG
jgi:hypothetical protein